MDVTAALERDLPARVGQIRQRFWRDPTFRIVCEDYRDACEALMRLEAAEPAQPGRIAEYRQLAGELLAEAADMLKGETG